MKIEKVAKSNLASWGLRRIIEQFYAVLWIRVGSVRIRTQGFDDQKFLKKLADEQKFLFY
jgi:hypothetical protein